LGEKGAATVGGSKDKRGSRRRSETPDKKGGEVIVGELESTATTQKGGVKKRKKR